MKLQRDTPHYAADETSMTKRVARAKRYRGLAEELRVLAVNQRTEEIIRKCLLGIAAEYDRMAKTCDATWRSEP
jgi:hypothetical protein